MEKIIVGFTGTQQGLTTKQKMEIHLILKHMYEVAKSQNWYPEFHHGDCVGADEQARNIAFKLGFEIHAHPCIIRNKRAFTEAHFTYPPKEPLSRNHDIVDICHTLIASPAGPEVLRSGTWSTVRYARKINRTVVIIMP